MPKIRQLWEQFVQAESSSYEKSSWCDLFLSQFIVELNDGNNVDEILTFCNWSGVGTLVGCELLSDIDQVCSQPGDGEDLRPLRHHLYTRGWRALTVLLSLGQQNFSCSNELANLLISLFPICLETSGNPPNIAWMEASNKYLNLKNGSDLDSFFIISPSKTKFSGVCGQFAQRGECLRSHSSGTNTRSRRSYRGPDNPHNSGERQSSESENTCDDLNLINKSCALKIKLDPMDFDYFTRAVRSDDDVRLDSVLYEPRRRPKHSKKITPADFMDEKIKDVMQSKVSPYEFSMLVVQLLTSLCRSENSFTIATENSYPVCLKSVKFALENLCSIQFGSVSTQILESRDAADLKSFLTQLLVTSLEKVMSCPDVTTNVILTGILPMMMRVLEDSVCKLLSDNNTLEVSITPPNEQYENEKQLQVIFGLICSAITFLISFLMQNSNVDRVRNFLELFKIFIESNNGKLIEKTVVVLVKFGSTTKAKKVVDLIGQFVTILKKVRKELVHPHSCRRFKHKKCREGTDLHHHHDLFGAVFTAPVVGSNSYQNCCVSSLFSELLRLLKKPDKISIEIINRTLKVMTSCGTCCCFSTKNLLGPLSEIIKLSSYKSRSLVFQLLENIVYPELGGYPATLKNIHTCMICSKRNNEEEEETDERKMSALDETSQRRSVKSEKSLSSHQSDASFPDANHFGKTSLRLDLFRGLLSSSDFQVVQGVTCHLLKCAPRMSRSVKHSILFNIFIPTFLSSKTQFLNECDEVSVFKILSSLSIFSSLLNSSAFAEEFISIKGLNHVLDLISVSVFTRHCCFVLEKTIVLGIVSPERSFNDDPALTTLRNAVDAATMAFLKQFRGNAEEGEFYIPNLPTAIGLKRKTQKENIETKTDRKRMEVLENVSTFWRTYANLCLCSPVMRRYFSQEPFLSNCNTLLKITIDCVTAKNPFVKEKNSKNRDTEGCLFTKLIESLLTFILATSNNEVNGKENKKNIIEQLSQSLLSSNLENLDVRRLAEVLIKCSLVQPSTVQVIPSDTMPKLLITPFWSSCGGVSEVEGNEERMISESDSLEDNYVTADEGYEADVEIRENTVSSGDVVELHSLRSVSESITFLSSHECINEKAVAKNDYLIMYPELCLLAVDLLINFYQEKKISDVSKIRRRRKDRPNKKPPNDKQVEVLSQVNENLEKVYLEENNESDIEEENIKEKEEVGERRNKESEGGKQLLSLISTFQRLVSLCKENQQNCSILCQNNIILKVLKGFQKLLVEKNENFSEAQKAILDLVTVLSKHSISTEELFFYLGFFKNNNPPVGLLLNPLLTLVTLHNPQPNSFYRFPIPVPYNFVHNSISDIGKNIHIQHKNEGIISCWSTSAMSIPIGNDINWAVWCHGFSLNLWLKLEKSNTQGQPQVLKLKTPQKPIRKVSKAESYISNCSMATTVASDFPANEITLQQQVSLSDLIHIFSIGNEALTLECWAFPELEQLKWRLTRIDIQRGYELISEKTTERCFPISSWNHVAINIKDATVRKKTVIEVTLIINGGREVSISLPFSGLLFRRYRQSSILIGTQSNQAKGFCSIGTLMVFTNPVFTRERAVYIMALGPNCTDLTDCQIGRRNPNFTSVFPMKTLTNEIDWENILNSKQEIIREMQNHLLIAYTPETPYTFNVYPPGFGTGSSLFSGLRPASSDLRATQQTPASLVPCIFAPFDQRKYQGIISSSIILGGSATFLFLFARVVELSNNADEQAKYLYLLLKLVQSDCDLFSQFVNNDHHNMLHKVFTASKCLSGLHILKAILDACCDKPIIQNNGGKFQVIQQSDAIIVNSFLITTILRSWKDWCSASQENEVLGMFFSALHSLLQDEHPSREFNASQLNRVLMVNSLLSFCKERLLYDDKKTLKPEVCVSIVELVKSLMGAPPEFSHIVSVMDCLILLHPVHSTYITHVKSSFYMLLTAGQTFATQGEQKYKSQSLESDSSKNGSYQFLNNWAFNFNVNTQLKMGTKYVSTVDPRKLSKALTNLQLKQYSLEFDKSESNRNRPLNEELDSNRYSDDLTFDSGIAGSCREQTENIEENDEIIVKAVDGSQQNLTSFFPATLGALAGSECKDNSFTEVSDEEEKCSNEKERKEIEEHEDCGPQCIIVEGLLLLLRDVILVLPDSMAQTILGHVVKLETLLVMANHKDHKVRSAVIKVFSSYLQRSTDEDVNKFIKLRGFYHLANQISLYPASQGLVEDCLQLLTRCSISLENHNFINEYEINYFGMACLPPLLALLPRSVHDLPLCHNLITIIRLLYCKDECTSRVLFENGLLETLVKTLVASAHFSSISDERLHQDIVLPEVFQFFIIIMNQALNTAGYINMQVVSDLRLELHYVYRLEKENCGIKSRCVRMIRDTLCKVLEKALDILHKKILCRQTIQKSRSSFFSSVLGGNQQDQGDTDNFSLPPPGYRYSNGFLDSKTLISSYPSKEISRSELSERFKILIVNAIEFLIYSEVIDGRNLLLSQTELNFIYHLFPLLLQILSSTLEKRILGRRQSYNGTYWAVRDTLKTETSNFLIWLLSPRQAVKTRMFAITTLMSQSNCKTILPILLHTPNQIEEKFTVFLWDLMYNNKLEPADLRSCQELKESIQQWGIISPQLIGSSSDFWGRNCAVLLLEADKQISLWEKQMEATTVRSISKHDYLVKGMSDDALTMTRLVVDAQNMERKSFMEEMKLRYSENIQISLKWAQLISNLTHEKGVWFFEKSYPCFWQLDPTEGPSRVRKRLARCHIDVDEKYFLPAYRAKFFGEKHLEPLSFLFEETKKSCTSMVLIERLHCNEKVRAMFSAHIITPAIEVPGELLVGETCIYFVADDRHSFQSLDASNTAWPYEDVKEIHNRRYELQERAVEIFLINGKTYFITFKTSNDRDVFMEELEFCDLPNKMTGDNLADIMQLWREGLITNWEYLTHLNKMSGRSYNDLMQYPVYPFILSDYTSSTLDLNNHAVYRNFRKPMAVQEKKNEQHYINNYNELLGGLKQVTLNKEPYHYGSHYSNSGTVLHFLVRLPPYTKMLLQYQDRNFDLPDRTFHSMHTTWRLASSESTTDVKEMLPEFFFLPEFLVNFQGFNFGIRQNGEPVDNVTLPPWCKNDPRRFILIHRQALESDYVTENLPHWIDLVFGYKQTGKAAVDAINVFHPATYCGFNVEAITDPVERIAWETMVKTYGQTPKQLLKTPHPLVVQSLVSGSNFNGQMCNEVKGLKWGSFVGSVSESEPSIAWRQQCKGKGIVSILLPLITNDVIGLSPFTTALLQYNKEKGFGLVNTTGIRVALVCWGYQDGIVRMKIKKELPLVPLLYISHLDPATICVSEPGCNRLWIGHSSGNLSVYKFKFIPDRESIDFSELPVVLQGHTKAVVCVAICRAFSITVSGGQDGVIIIWDLNHATYVRSLDLNSGPVKILALSNTLGDIATVTQCSDKANNANVLHLHTINATFVASVAIKETVTSVCFSTAPEGISVNLIACGLENGTIRLFNSWDLTYVRDINSPIPHPITSLTYSHDSQLLYASFRDGTIVTWESSSSNYGIRTPKFLNLQL